MTASALTAQLAAEFSDVPPALIASTVRAAAAHRGDGDLPVEVVARTDVAALAEAVRRSGTARSR